MIALDASVLIAHLNPADAYHDDATRVLMEATDEDLVVHAVTMAEVLVGGARIGRGKQMEADLLNLGLALAAHDDGEPLRLAELRAASGLKLPDCCVLDVALVNSASLATFDRALAAAGRERGLLVIP